MGLPLGLHPDGHDSEHHLSSATLQRKLISPACSYNGILSAIIHSS